MWELDHKDGWVLKNRCFQTVVLEKTPESPWDCKGIKSVNSKGNQSWLFIGRTDAEAPVFPTWWEELTHWKRPRCWQRLKARGEAGNRGWNGWMASLTQWTCVWANSEGWWETAKPGVLHFMGLQRVDHDLVTEKQQQWICLGCHNKTLQIWWLKEQTFISSQLWRSRIQVSAGLVSPEGSLLGSQMPPLCSPVSSQGLFLVCAPLVSCLILTRTPVFWE